MKELEIKATVRAEKKKKVKLIREQGKLPVVLYGHGIKPQILVLDKKEFSKVYKQAGSSTLVKLYIGENKEPQNVLLHQIDYHPVTDEIIHADLFQVKLTEKIKTEISIMVIGAEDAPVVKEKEGSIITNKDHVEVEAFPQDLVHEITVDVSKLSEFNQTIYVKDLIIPAKIAVLDDPEEVVIMIQEPRSEEELAKLEEEVKEDVEAVAVEEKGKVEEDEGGEKTAEGSAESSTEKSEPSDKKE